MTKISERIQTVLFGYNVNTLMKLAHESLDRHEAPLYSVSEVALYVGVARSTLRSWLKPTASIKRIAASPPLIEPANPEDLTLSFYNLCEAHILLATRRQKKISMPRVRRALDFVRERYPSPHPLLDKRFRTAGKHIFIHEIEGLDPINVSGGGQVTFSQILEEHLERVVPDASTGFPEILYPIGTNHIEIDLHSASGRPTVKNSGVLAATLWDRAQAGESIDSLAYDYDIPKIHVEEAVGYIRDRSHLALIAA